MRVSRLLNEHFSKILIITGAAFAFLAVLFFTYKASLFNFDVAIDTAIFGQFGDVVGGVIGSLWALAGVILFYVGLTEQRKAIKLNESALLKQIEALGVQKEEMTLLREEYVNARQVFTQQKEVLSAQANTSKIQQFESNFYSLINIYTNITKELFGSEGDLKKITNELRKARISSEKDFKNRIDLLVIRYISIYQNHKDKISHYLKTVYRIYKIIDEESSFSDRQKFFYAKIIRSQFTEEELFIIYYNSLSKYGTNFRTLILKYNLLKHLNFLSKIEVKEHKGINETFNYRRECFCEHLESSLLKITKLIDNIEIDNPRLSINISIDDIEVTIDYHLDEDSYLLIDFHCNSSTYIALGMKDEDKFYSFLNFFILDRFFNNNFETLSVEDSIKRIPLDDARFRLKVVTDIKLKINDDRY